MARNEADREDLMREAVSLVKRIECRCPSRKEPVVVGLNVLGWMFVYLGSDPMYRFDERGRLRRAFVDGFLFRTEGQTLAVLDRRRNLEPSETAALQKATLYRRDLNPVELDAFRRRMQIELEEVSEGIRIGGVTQQHPEDVLGIADEIERKLRLVIESREFLAPAIVRR